MGVPNRLQEKRFRAFVRHGGNELLLSFGDGFVCGVHTLLPLLNLLFPSVPGIGGYLLGIFSVCVRWLCIDF